MNLEDKSTFSHDQIEQLLKVTGSNVGREYISTIAHEIEKTALEVIQETATKMVEEADLTSYRFEKEARSIVDQMEVSTKMIYDFYAAVEIILKMKASGALGKKNYEEMEMLIRQHDLIVDSVYKKHFSPTSISTVPSGILTEIDKVRIIFEIGLDLFPQDLELQNLIQSYKEKKIDVGIIKEKVKRILQTNLGNHPIDTVIDKYVARKLLENIVEQSTKLEYEIYEGPEASNVIAEGFFGGAYLTIGWFEGLDIGEDAVFSMRIGRRSLNYTIQYVDLIVKFWNKELDRFDERHFPIIKDGKPGTVILPGGGSYTFSSKLFTEIENTISYLPEPRKEA